MNLLDCYALMLSSSVMFHFFVINVADVKEQLIWLKLEIKGPLLVSFGKTTPLAKQPCISLELSWFVFTEKFVLVYLALLVAVFVLANPTLFGDSCIWPLELPDGCHLEFVPADEQLVQPTSFVGHRVLLSSCRHIFFQFAELSSYQPMSYLNRLSVV